MPRGDRESDWVSRVGGGWGNGPAAPGNCRRHDGRRHEGALGRSGRRPPRSEALGAGGRAGSAGLGSKLVAVWLRGPFGTRPFPALRRRGLVVSEGGGGGRREGEGGSESAARGGGRLGNSFISGERGRSRLGRLRSG